MQLTKVLRRNPREIASQIIEAIDNTLIFDNIENIDISISHCKEYAVATVVVLYNE